MKVWIDDAGDVVWNDDSEIFHSDWTHFLIDGVYRQNDASQECGLWMILE